MPTARGLTDTGLMVTGVTVTPVAVQDPPLLAASGVHPPYALRSVIEVHTDAGVTGISEAYGDEPGLGQLKRVAAGLAGLDVFDLNGLTRRVVQVLGGDVVVTGPTELIGPAGVDKSIAQLVGAFEVAFFDAQGRATGRRVADLLGGAVRETVDFSAYLFYKWAEHPAGSWDASTLPPYAPDEWGAALDPAGIVEQARTMVDRHGFRSLKLKGGVMPPREEVEAVKALRAAFPDHPIRLDPNANWTVETSLKVAEQLADDLEYFEDPTGGVPGMAEVARHTRLPLATNMCVTSFADIPEAIQHGAVQIILSDHHYWGGFRASQRLAGICETFGLGLSMHSNTHLGISLAAMTHLAAATPNLTYALDTHSPWKTEEVIDGGPLRFVDGALTLPIGPGLGVDIDRDQLARLHEQYLKCGVRKRDDVAAMRLVRPEWDGKRPMF